MSDDVIAVEQRKLIRSIIDRLRIEAQLLNFRAANREEEARQPGRPTDPLLQEAGTLRHQATLMEAAADLITVLTQQLDRQWAHDLLEEMTNQ